MDRFVACNNENDKELTADEKKHIIGSLAIAFGNLQLEELEEKNKLKEKEGVA